MDSISSWYTPEDYLLTSCWYGQLEMGFVSFVLKRSNLILLLFPPPHTFLGGVTHSLVCFFWPVKLAHLALLPRLQVRTRQKRGRRRRRRRQHWKPDNRRSAGREHNPVHTHTHAQAYILHYSAACMRYTPADTQETKEHGHEMVTWLHTKRTAVTEVSAHVLTGCG